MVGGLSGLVLMVCTKLVEKAVGRRADRRAEHSVILAELEACRKELHTTKGELNDEVRRRRDVERQADTDLKVLRDENRGLRDERDLAEEGRRLARAEAQDAIGRMQGLYRKISELERDNSNLTSDLETSNGDRERLRDQNRILLEAWPLTRKPLPPMPPRSELG